MKIKGIQELKAKYNNASKKRRIEAEINNYAHYPEKFDNATLTTLVLNFKELMENPDTLPSSGSIKKLISTLMSDGRYRELDIDTFRDFISSLYKIKSFYDSKDLSDYIISLRQQELKRIKREFEFGEDKSTPEQKSKELDMLYELMYQAGVFLNTQDDSRDTIIELLKEKYNIDLRKGINISNVPDFVYDSSVDIITLLMIQTQKNKEWNGIIDSNLEILRKKVENVIATSPTGKAEDILLQEPLILELYNLANCEIELEGQILPSKENREKIKEILSLLPKPKELTQEEKDFINKGYFEYKKTPMKKEDWDKAINIYLREVLSLVASGKYENQSLFLHSDLLLGQLIMDNPIARPENDSRLGNFYKIALRDYANGILKDRFPYRKSLVQMSEDRSRPDFLGMYYFEIKGIYIKGRIQNRKELLRALNSVAHEIKHAQTDSYYSLNTYSTPLEYIAIKLRVLMDNIPSIVKNGGFNYLESAFEMLARLSGTMWMIGAMQEHGVDIEKDEEAQIAIGLYNKDEERSQNSRLIKNPKYYKKTTYYEQLKKEREQKLAKLVGEEKEVVFDSELYKKYLKENIEPVKQARTKQIKEEKIFDDEKGAIIDIHNAFDKFVKNHCEYCYTGSFFSIEYNKNGERKSLREILRDMRSLGKDDSYDEKRAIYKYIIEACIIPDTRAYEAIDALIEYRSANAKDEQLVTEIVDEMIEPLLLRVAKEAQPIESKKEMDELIARIVDVCKEDDKRVQKSRQTHTQSKLKYTPFVKGITRHARKNRENQKKPSLFTPADIGKKFFGRIIDKYDKIESLGTTDYIPL